MGSLAIIIPFFRRHRWRVFWGLSFLICVDGLQLVMPRIVKHAVDDLTLGRATLDTLTWQGGGLVALALGVAALRAAWRPLLMGFSRQVERDLRQQLFDQVQRLHVGFLQDHPPGQIMSRATEDLSNIRMALGIGLVAAVDGVVMGALSLGAMVQISWQLTLLAAVPMPLVVLLTRHQSKRLHKNYTQVQNCFAQLTEQAREALAGVGLVKAFALTGREIDRLENKGREYFRHNLATAKREALLWPFMIFLSSVSLALVLGGGGPMVVLGRISPGDLVAIIAYLGMLTWPMMALGWVVSLMQRARASLDRLKQIQDIPPAITDPEPAAVPQPQAPPQVEITDLTFQYPGAAFPILAGLNLFIPPQRATALVGRVGSGKSTLLHLITRLIDPPPDTIKVSGLDIRAMTQAELRRRVVLVPQEAFLFSASLRENLLLGDPGADDQTLWAALEAAGIADEVRALTGGLDAMLGEKALNLSGGQRQRLTLARALLAEAPVLLLDDPLAAVDAETEEKILRNLAVWRGGRTTLMVSHRLASVSFAEHIHVLSGGRVVENGTHQELLAQGGIYHELFARQRLVAEVEGRL